MSFIFPLCWKHTLIPILPAEMIDYLDSPYIYLIGIESAVLSEACYDLSGSDVTQVMLDANSIYTNEVEVDRKTKMPVKEFRTLKEKLLRATACIKQRPDPILEQVDQAFTTVFVDPDDDSEGVDEIEVRDAFLEFMSKTMGDYKKFLRDLNNGKDGIETLPEHANSRDFFDRDKFLLSKDS